MAIYHLTTKAVSRAKGQSSIASAAYRSGEKIENERTGEISDYTRKQEVDHKEIIGFSGSRSELWNQAEQAEKRKDATLAKEYEVALPKELNRDQKIELAREYGNYLHERHKVAVDICIHKIDSSNPHAHILTTTREVKNGNELGDKTAREWSDTKRKKHGLTGRKNDLLEAREKWETLANRALERAQIKERIDHRSLKNQGIDREPQIHIGATAAAMERKGIQTERGNINRSRMNLVKLRNEFNQVHNQRVKLGAQKRIEQSQAQARADKINSLPNTLKELERFKQLEVEKANYLDGLRVKRASERLERLTLTFREKYNEHKNSKPLEPTGLLKALKQSSYEKRLTEWTSKSLELEKRLNDLKARQYRIEQHKQSKLDLATKQVERDIPELGQKIALLNEQKAQHQAEIAKRREAAKKPKRPKMTKKKDLKRGFER